MNRLRSRAPFTPALIAALGAGVVALAGSASSAQAPVSAPAKTAAPASGQPGAFALGNSTAPIDITADGTDIHQDVRQVVYYGNVEAIQGTARLNTPRLTVFYVPRATPGGQPAQPANSGIGSSSVERIECEGPVYYTTPTQNAKGDHGTYIQVDDTITLTGNVVLVQDKNVSTGDKLVIEQKTGHATLTTRSGRVRAVLYPNQNQAGAPAPVAKTPGRP